jgi:hypothetical protein
MAPQMPEGIFPVTMLAPQTTNGGPTSDYISLKNAQMAWVDVHLTQAAVNATAFTIERATDVAGTGHVALANSVPIWYGNISTTSNALTRQANGVGFTLGGAVTGSVRIIFQIDPAKLGADFDVISFVSANSGEVTNLISVTCWVWPKFASRVADQMSFITD